MDFATIALVNEQALRNNSYPGRILVLGKTEKGNLVQVYSIMGRSEGSRNRIFEQIPKQPGFVRTCVADESKTTGDPALTIYTVMAEKPGYYIVSNGCQTDAVMKGGIFSLNGLRYEDDGPNFTPRITGVIGSLNDMLFVILRKSDFDDNRCCCFDYYYPEVANGFGYMVSTYSRNGDPLPPFRGEPRIIPIKGNNPEEIGKEFAALLNEDNLVSVVAKVIHPGRASEIAIINKYEKKVG